MPIRRPQGPHEGVGRVDPSNRSASDAAAAEASVPDEAPERFAISTLSERSGTSIPTIHHYRRLELIPPAEEVASNRFLYGDRHLEALQVIRLLRERRNLSLEAIRDVLPELLSFTKGGVQEPELWDRVILSYLERSGQGEVASRLVVAARTCFAERGYAGVNVAEICRTAKVAKGSFYRYFDSKEAIFL